MVTHRQVLPDTRSSLTHKFSINGHEGYLTVGLHPDGRPGEIFIKMAKEGSTMSGMCQAFCPRSALRFSTDSRLRMRCSGSATCGLSRWAGRATRISPNARASWITSRGSWS